jgi:hypothetical protein
MNSHCAKRPLVDFSHFDYQYPLQISSESFLRCRGVNWW